MATHTPLPAPFPAGPRQQLATAAACVRPREDRSGFRTPPPPPHANATREERFRPPRGDPGDRRKVPASAAFSFRQASEGPASGRGRPCGVGSGGRGGRADPEASRRPPPVTRRRERQCGALEVTPDLKDSRGAGPRHVGGDHLLHQKRWGAQVCRAGLQPPGLHHRGSTFRGGGVTVEEVLCHEHAMKAHNTSYVFLQCQLYFIIKQG
ncbi:uncharacterized protein LOC112653484 isoform X3 [Canis lupus dingo]|uniref:uncharacterized protein LOC112653484 isoform X3 n=1 Tax=Canis lupus dingo TaxID=286419 RepID=UPI000DC68CCE|nr:uncharacterized protein LOC112653484 isoform X3 [Canis lupus dingo]